ncbi:MAG TPA: hypothetical protein VNO30_20320 [Kofleriaceae bacterium]|nr:hypothetical protein [Kofleriaceae bacterium]
MTAPLRPHTALASSNILDVAALAGGGYAVLTDAGIERFDAQLAPRGAIPGAHSGAVLVELPGERFLVHGASLSWLYEGAAGGALAKVELGDALVRAIAVTEAGFLAINTDHVLVDHAGARRFMTPPPGCLDLGGVPWRGGAAIAGYEGLAILGADGAIAARSSGEQPRQRPVALADALAVPTAGDVAVFDGAARVIARIPRRVEGDALVPFRGGVLTCVHDEDARETEVSYWELAGAGADAAAAPPAEAGGDAGADAADAPPAAAGGDAGATAAAAAPPALAPRWRVTRPGSLRPPAVVGDRVVLASRDTGAWILDGDGAELAHLTTDGPTHDVAAFDDGLALIVQRSPDVLWWRPEAEPARLSHDVWPSLVRAVPAGLVSTEGSALYVWRADVQGPAFAPLATDLPMHAPLVIGGTPLQIVGAGRFALRAVTLDGRPMGVRPGTPWRPMTPRDEAARIVERLVQRTFDGPVPAVPRDVVIFELVAQLAQLPLAATVDLHGRALFAGTSLDPEVRARSAWAREAFFDELGAALGTPGRVLLAAVKSRKLKLDPPRPVLGYEYLGTFTTSGKLTVSDPCYVGKKASSAGVSLSLKVDGHPGVWHVFLRPGDGALRDRTAELVTIHDEGFDVFAADRIGQIGIDSGTAGVFDKSCPRRDGDTPLEEGTFAALGAIASAGYGDGVYPVFAGRVKGRVGKLRLSFLGDDAEVDRSVARPAGGAAKPYRASERFAFGDTIEHVKFGVGSVTRVGTDGKIDVRFADGTRTLIHGKK